MKFFLFVMTFLSILGSTNAQTSQAEKWACVAYGYDSNNNYRGVPGDFADTEVQAKDSAVSMCVMAGYYACEVKSCYSY